MTLLWIAELYYDYFPFNNRTKTISIPFLNYLQEATGVKSEISEEKLFSLEIRNETLPETTQTLRINTKQTILVSGTTNHQMDYSYALLYRTVLNTLDSKC